MMAGISNGALPSTNATSEHDDFIATLRTYHQDRGTTFESEPKIGQKRVDLLRLYHRVVEEGGYDRVSDTKVGKGQWRNIGVDLGLDKATHPSTLAFMLKTVYYKNLAAYEITTVHGKEPPPREILEDVSAKGGNLLTRTLDSYRNADARQDIAEENDGDGTPKAADKVEIDAQATGRATREGLRQAPPQRQLFQSDASMTRQTRNQNGYSPAPGYSFMHFFGNATAAQALSNYEPKPSIPLAIRPATTPANNPELFKAQQSAIRDAHLANMSKPPLAPRPSIMLPGTGFPGPNVYIRTWMALKSPIIDEQEYALHHLVRISHEKGDKYRLDNFSGLAEALIDKLLETTGFFYDLEWALSYQDGDTRDSGTLDALNGTPDLLKLIAAAQPRKPRDKVESLDMTRKIKLINEAGLVMRNMVFLDENAEYVSRYPSMHDALVVLIHLPDEPFVLEVKQYAFEIAEQMSKFRASAPGDSLTIGLMAATASSDRGVILTCLKALSRVGTRLDHVSPLYDVPKTLIHRLCQWLLVDDEDLRSATLDLLYRLTASIGGVELLLRETDLESLLRQLIRLLQHGARQQDLYESELSANIDTRRPTQNYPEIPKISADHVDMLLTYDEPERSSQWLRACFEEHPQSEITQIALWQAYQIPFAPFSTTRPLLPAKDFITNVSTTFTYASAQVLSADPPKFIIKGVRPRSVPVDPKGKPFMKCHWLLRDTGAECGDFALTAERMWEHVVGTHLGVQKDGEGNYDFANMDGKGYQCQWADCNRFTKEADPVSSFTVGMHVKTHMPDTSSLHWLRNKHNISSDTSDGAIPPDLFVPSSSARMARFWSYANTFVDERSDVPGLSLTSALVLRNLARNIPKTSLANAIERKENEFGLVQALFAPVKAQLYFVMAYNRSLGEYLSSLIKLIDDEA